jgi:hypothetical protein
VSSWDSDSWGDPRRSANAEPEAAPLNESSGPGSERVADEMFHVGELSAEAQLIGAIASEWKNNKFDSRTQNVAVKDEIFDDGDDVLICEGDTLKLSKIQFTHNSVGGAFRDGRHLEDSIQVFFQAMKDGAEFPDWSTLDIFQVESAHYTENNRRLLCMKMAASRAGIAEDKVHVKVRVERLGTKFAKFLHAYTTENQGGNPRIRRLASDVLAQKRPRLDKGKGKGERR